LRRAFKLQAKLGVDGGIWEHIPKPKWMRWQTYDRLLKQIESAEQTIDGHLAAFLYKLEPARDDDPARRRRPKAG